MLSDIFPASSLNPAVGPNKRHCILLTTDDYGRQQNILSYLSDTYRVHLHCSEESLCGSLSQYKPDVELHGCTLIAVTGWGSEADRRRAVDAGFDYHFTNPRMPSSLSRCCARALSPRCG